MARTICSQWEANRAETEVQKYIKSSKQPITTVLYFHFDFILSQKRKINGKISGLFFIIYYFCILYFQQSGCSNPVWQYKYN